MLSKEKSEELKLITDRFIDILHELYGVYLDSLAGFKLYNQEIEQKIRQGAPGIIFAKGDPDDSEAIILHGASIKEIFDRNSANGLNVIRMRHYILVMIVSHWNEDIRKKIENVLAIRPDDVKADILGDLNKLRNDILKNREKANKSVNNIIFKFQKNEFINISSEMFDRIFEEIHKYLNILLTQNTCLEGYSDRSLNLKIKEWHSKTIMNP